ncbi:MAG: hypothetical protein WCE45_08985, partial [Sedimentisphaerales bacterium]
MVTSYNMGNIRCKKALNGYGYEARFVCRLTLNAADYYQHNQQMKYATNKNFVSPSTLLRTGLCLSGYWARKDSNLGPMDYE